MSDILQISGLSKFYANGFHALKNINLNVHEAEILALLGPNGAGKTTLISTICGISRFSAGSVKMAGYDIVQQYRAARSLIGLVPQELALEPFETVENTLRFSRGLFGKAPDEGYLSSLLEALSLSDKKTSQIRTLSGGMKRRLSIAKALSHQPRLLFLDEPTAGVDVELRKDMWALVERLRASGVTIILTTHYIEEAEAIADRIGIIDQGALQLVEAKDSLMQRLGKKQLQIDLLSPLPILPPPLLALGVTLAADGLSLIYQYDLTGAGPEIEKLFSEILALGLKVKDLQTGESSLEEIFLQLVSEAA